MPGSTRSAARCSCLQVIRIMLPICMKAALDGTFNREAARERDRASLEELDRKLRSEQPGDVVPES
jgi:hypothetical protein